MTLTPLEIELLACLREYRRLENQGVRDVRETDACHVEADRLLRLQPDLDTPEEHYDAPNRVDHRRFVDSLVSRRYRGY